MKAFPVIIDRQCPNLFRSIGIKRWGEVGGGGAWTSHQVWLGKIWARFSQIYQISGKTWEVLSPQDAKVGKKSLFCNFGIVSEIQRAKFGALVTYIFGGKIWGSNKNFGSKFWGQGPVIRPACCST